ncbi:hypothetical protein D3C71_2168600 [compost metagenome]
MIRPWGGSARGTARLVELQLAAGVDLAVVFDRDVKAGTGDIDLAIGPQLNDTFPAFQPQ